MNQSSLSNSFTLIQNSECIQQLKTKTDLRHSSSAARSIITPEVLVMAKELTNGCFSFSRPNPSPHASSINFYQMAKTTDTSSIKVITTSKPRPSHTLKLNFLFKTN